MAYDITLGVNIASDLSSAYLIDSTVYGGSDPARNTVLVFASGFKMTSNNTVSSTLVLTPNDTDPLIVTQWSFPYIDSVADGWFQFWFAIITDIYNSGTTYDIYDAVYDSSTKLVYRSKVASNIGNALSNSTYWEYISDPSTLANNEGETNQSQNIQSLVYQRILSFISQQGYGTFVSDQSEECCSDCGDEEADKTYNLLSLLVNGAVQADVRQQLPQGQVICERITGILSTC